MSITELRDKYQKDLEYVTSLLEELTEKDAPLRQMLQTDKNYFKHFISDLNALIQSEDKERNELQVLMDDISAWSDKTFGNGQRNPAIAYHLKKEINELITALSADNYDRYFKIREEFADCFMLLLDSAKHAGFTANELIQALKDKLEINKLRKWGKPDENGVVEHIRGESEKGGEG